MPVSLPEGVVGVSVSFRTISLPFEAIRGEYLSRTQWSCEILERVGRIVDVIPSADACILA